MVLRSSYLLPVPVCELGGALRKYRVAFCFLGRRGLCTGFKAEGFEWEGREETRGF